MNFTLKTAEKLREYIFWLTQYIKHREDANYPKRKEQNDACYRNCPTKEPQMASEMHFPKGINIFIPIYN